MKTTEGKRNSAVMHYVSGFFTQNSKNKSQNMSFISHQRQEKENNVNALLGIHHWKSGVVGAIDQVIILSLVNMVARDLQNQPLRVQKSKCHNCSCSFIAIGIGQKKSSVKCHRIGRARVAGAVTLNRVTCGRIYKTAKTQETTAPVGVAHCAVCVCTSDMHGSIGALHYSMQIRDHALLKLRCRSTSCRSTAYIHVVVWLSACDKK